MAISRKSTEPSGVTNTSGQPEIVLEIEGMIISMTPPATNQASGDQADEAAADDAATNQPEKAETDR